MSADEIEKMLKIAKGDIIRLDYSGYLVDGGDLFDTSNADVAKEGGLFDENVTYGAIPVLVGSGRLFEGLDEAIINSNVGEDREIVLTPEKAAGPRDPKLIEQIPLREFLRQEIEPQVGMEVNMKNRVGMVMSVSPRMVRVDFNRRFAGRPLRYKFKVVCKITDDVEKVQSLIQMDYGSAEGFGVKVDGENYDITLPDVCKYDQKWILAKYKVVADLRESFNAKTIHFIEEYLKKDEAKKDEAKPESREPEELPQ
jgi:FKBP-type peptidyl-prolyl cis-trans isomerase 2